MVAIEKFSIGTLKSKCLTFAMSFFAVNVVDIFLQQFGFIDFLPHLQVCFDEAEIRIDESFPPHQCILTAIPEFVIRKSNNSTMEKIFFIVFLGLEHITNYNLKVFQVICKLFFSLKQN